MFGNRRTDALRRARDERDLAGELAQARAQIEQEIAAARDGLRAQVAALAVAGAEKILEAQVDAKAHAGMLDKLAAEL